MEGNEKNNAKPVLRLKRQKQLVRQRKRSVVSKCCPLKLLLTDHCNLAVDYCPAGHFMKKKSECVPCHRGQYREANTDVSSCISCPALHTTLEEGSTQIKDCVCERNTFLNQKNKCQNCPLGAESEPGSFSEHHCKCPLGTTSDPTYSFCTRKWRILAVFSRLIDSSLACPKGTFGGSGRRLGCSLCPEWWTTSKPGAKVESECCK